MDEFPAADLHRVAMVFTRVTDHWPAGCPANAHPAPWGRYRVKRTSQRRSAVQHELCTGREGAFVAGEVEA